MNSIKDRLTTFLSELPRNCTLVAVSKTKPNEDVLEAYETGHRDFGENKVQELARKAEELPPDIKWHMIGHLQRNKVKYIAPFVYLIHGVDSLRLLQEIDKQGAKNERVIDCLIQVHIAEESTKFGFDNNELKELISGSELSKLAHIKVTGLMGMATNTKDEAQVAKEFQSLREIFDWCAGHSKHTNTDFKVLSSGMSGDYKIALQQGSNMVRIGSSIFGERNYMKSPGM